LKLPIRACLPAFLCILIAAAGAGCEKASEPGRIPPPEAPAAAAAWPAKGKTDRGNFTVTIQPEGGGITRNKHFALEVLVEPAAGAGAPTGVVVDADMPSHGHGMNTKAETTHEEGPRYRARGMLFHMAGEWSIVVEVTAGAAQERAFFPVTIE
jgi:YtkA-like